MGHEHFALYGALALDRNIYCEDEPGRGLRRQRRQHRGAAAREQRVKPFVVITVPRRLRSTELALFARSSNRIAFQISFSV